MKIKTYTLAWLISLVPLNSSFNSYANSIEDYNTVSADKTIENFTPPFLFDIDQEQTEENCEVKSPNYLLEFQQNNTFIAPEAIEMALNAYQYLNDRHKLTRSNILTIVDFSKPSTAERLFVIDLKAKKVIYKSLCAHGQNSGENYATRFSNQSNSYQSSLGAFVANETYIGANGLSLRLDGMEAGINSNARNRSVVIHGADYVSYDFIKSHGRLGRSQGCPALPRENTEKIISTLKGGSCLFIYHPNMQYKTTSAIYKAMDKDNLQNLFASIN